MKNLRFICAQPATTYYVWQVEVMINNFIEMGISPNTIDVVCYIRETGIPEEWTKLANAYPVRFFFYKDMRLSKEYVSSIRPNILKQHFKNNPELQNEAIFYHDCDIVFTKQVNWSQFLEDNKWYGSDCRWYIGHDYILSKGVDVLNKMCDIVQIDKEIIRYNETNSIGAQYLMKNINWEFWHSVERHSEMLYRDITLLNTIKIQNDANHHPIQIWCADMWAVLWNGWKLQNETICHTDLQFSWATSPKEHLDEYNIFHNAGVTNNMNGLFFKSDYTTEYPYNKDLTIDKNTCSYFYWQEIQKTAQKSVLL